MLVMDAEMVLSGFDQVFEFMGIEPFVNFPSFNLGGFVSEGVSNSVVALGILVDEGVDSLKGGTGFSTETCLDSSVDMSSLDIDWMVTNSLSKAVPFVASAVTVIVGVSVIVHIS